MDTSKYNVNTQKFHEGDKVVLTEKTVDQILRPIQQGTIGYVVSSYWHESFSFRTGRNTVYEITSVHFDMSDKDNHTHSTGYNFEKVNSNDIG